MQRCLKLMTMFLRELLKQIGSSRDMVCTESPIKETGTLVTEHSSPISGRVACRYRARARQAPVWYDPTDSQTLHVMVY